jgi:hypothetical protein
MNTGISFRNSKITYYGPHQCENCGVAIVKMGREWGGNAFTNPEGPIFPNTEWHPHVCDPHLVRERKALFAGARVGEYFPQAHARKIGQLGFVIMGENIPENVSGGKYLVVSANQTFYDTMEAAWDGALERIEKGWPSWHIDLSVYTPKSRFGNDLDMLPQCPA